MWIKICGITNVENALNTVQCHVDAIGLISIRSPVDLWVMEPLPRLLRRLVKRWKQFGVFVNLPTAAVVRKVRDVGLSLVQFHGDETSDDIREFAAACPDTGIIRAFRIGDSGLAAAIAEVNQLREAGVRLRAVLVDAAVTGSYGGTGTQIRPQLLGDLPADWPPLILAGGLNPTTVGAAVAQTRPWGVDTASGVESAPGVKAIEMVRQFVAAARQNA